ncbi:hypothetical protein F5890DRAFT_1533799 [Lentinula detonsa]|uniref:Uncharacterized protein n=1 Tax=Lentinula detonsa TaxID=2804962 RepID=A0AA38PU67_9AGAR|nr:hypothetical protein F5890DRAFT_1533799 [Lentinula detonsa]
MITSPYVHDEYKEYVNGDAPSSSFSFPVRYVNLKVLSHIAVQSQELPRGTHVTGGIPYPGGFMGKDIVSQFLVQRELLINHGVSTSNR